MVKNNDKLSQFKTLGEIPTLSVTDIKQSPMSGFHLAESEETGVYITRRSDVVGVMLTKKQYEQLIHALK